MSFKRAGDDHCALRLQKKQRVAELFAEDIPEDEVNKTRSGKYLCLVCPHNPVLDTMPMLSIHRQGKRHLANMSIKIEREYNLQELDEKHKQELYLKNATTNIKLSKSGNNSLQSVDDDGSEISPLLARTQQLTENVSKGVQGNHKRCEEVRNKQPKCWSKRKKPFFQSRVELTVDVQKSKFDKRNDKLNLEAVTASASKDGVISGSGSFLAAKGREKFHPKCTVAACSFSSSNMTNHGQVHGHCSTFTDRQSMETDATGFEKATQLNSGNIMNKEQQKKYLELKMSGWILNSDGQWVKDENVEFDSDEEEPNNLLLVKENQQ